LLLNFFNFPRMQITSLRFWRRHAQLIGYVPLTRYRDGLGLDGGLLVFGAHRALQGYFAVLADDLNVVSIGRQRLVIVKSRANLLGELAVGWIHFLLIGRGCVCILV